MNKLGILTCLKDFFKQHGMRSQKKLEQEKIMPLLDKLKLLEDMHKIISLLPAPIYWEDVNSIILGANDYIIEELGIRSLNDYIGKSLHELYPKEMADHIKWHNEEVMRTGQILSQEEAIIDMRGNLKYFTAIKAPLRDDQGNIIGIVGTSINITQQKEAERLKLQEQEKFTKIANQVAHDIRSPLSSLLMIVKSCSHIPEADRIALREAAIAISDIANHLLHQYQKKEADMMENEERQAVLVSAALLESLTAKKYQYQKFPVKFDCCFKTDTQFSFIKTELSAFKRMLSNLINNAVDALENTAGKISLQLEVSNEWVKIAIQDTGKGMSAELINQILSKVSITRGKKQGYGIGLMQVRDTLERNQGEWQIESALGLGTTITLTFPRMQAPHWIAEKISLSPHNIVIIVDDDTSIHGAWRTRFEAILNGKNTLQLQHFEQASEALAYINGLTQDEKESLLLLTDYELLKQDFNGLDLIAQSKIKNSILVTSHYADPLILEQAAQTNTKILPKQLASEIPICFEETEKHTVREDGVDVIFVDNDKLFIQTLTMFIFKDQRTTQYYDPQHFLDSVHQYPKETKIYLDNNFPAFSLKGIDIARKLYAQGFERLYLLSGEVFDEKDIPGYLTVIRKDDIAAIKTL